MDYSVKYIKYKKKYLNLKNKTEKNNKYINIDGAGPFDILKNFARSTTQAIVTTVTPNLDPPPNTVITSLCDNIFPLLFCDYSRYTENLLETYVNDYDTYFIEANQPNENTVYVEYFIKYMSIDSLFKERIEDIVKIKKNSSDECFMNLHQALVEKNESRAKRYIRQYIGEKINNYNYKYISPLKNILDILNYINEQINQPFQNYLLTQTSKQPDGSRELELLKILNNMNDIIMVIDDNITKQETTLNELLLQNIDDIVNNFDNFNSEFYLKLDNLAIITIEYISIYSKIINDIFTLISCSTNQIMCPKTYHPIWRCPGRNLSHTTDRTISTIGNTFTKKTKPVIESKYVSDSSISDDV